MTPAIIRMSRAARPSPAEHHRSCRRAQPMTNEDSRLWIVYNGEIFNHAALRPRAGTAPDTATRRAATPKPSCTLTRVRRGLRRALPRHVRLRHLGRNGAHAVLRPRPAGDQAALLFLERPHVRLRFGNQGSSGASGDLAPTSKSRSVARISGIRIHQRASNAVSRHPEADAGASSHARSGRNGRSLASSGIGTFPLPARAQRHGRRRSASRMPPPPGRNGRACD